MVTVGILSDIHDHGCILLPGLHPKLGASQNEPMGVCQTLSPSSKNGKGSATPDYLTIDKKRLLQLKTPEVMTIIVIFFSVCEKSLCHHSSKGAILLSRKTS